MINFLEKTIKEKTRNSIKIGNIHWKPFSSIEFKNINLAHEDKTFESSIELLKVNYKNPWKLIHLNFESLVIKCSSLKLNISQKDEAQQDINLALPETLPTWLPHLNKLKIEIASFTFKNQSGSFSGSSSLHGMLSLNNQNLTLKLGENSSHISFESQDGKIFIDKMKIKQHGNVVLDLQNVNPVQVNLELSFGDSEVVYNSFYGNFKNTFFTSKLALQLQKDKETFTIKVPKAELYYNEKKLLEAHGEIKPQGKSIQLEIASALENITVLQTITQSSLSESYSFLKDLEIKGGLNLKINVHGQLEDLSFSGECGLSEFSLYSPSKKINLKNTNLLLPFSFSQNESRELSAIENLGKFSFESLTQDKISLKKVAFILTNANNAISIKTPISLNVLDGTLNFKKMLFQIFPKDKRRVELSFSAHTLSFKKICEFLGLPKTSGNLNSKIDLFKLTSSDLAIKGTTTLHAWDGSVVIKNLNIAEPFGLVPTLAVGSININKVRLLPITQDLGFGIIDGTVEGYIKNLTIIDKKPTSFAMEVKNVSDSNSSQVISIQAIKNITQLSGDPSSFSNSFMFGLVDRFKYSHLGFKASLDGELLQLEPNYASGTTAYLIKGSFFPPSVDVLYKNEVHRTIPLPELIERLKNIDWNKTYVK